jgi:endonuclease III
MKRPDKKMRDRATVIILRLEQSIPGADTALNHDSPFQLLIATILSAQCTDIRVNQVTPILFQRFPGPAEMLLADSSEMESIIRSTGFFKNKAKNVISCARQIVTHFGGEVPETLKELVSLPGVGRKTANVVLGTAFHKQAIVVDTHVRRVSRRLRLSRSNDPLKIEADLNLLLDKEIWTSAAHRLLLHGRYVCKARQPRCAECTLSDLCAERREA